MFYCNFFIDKYFARLLLFLQTCFAQLSAYKTFFFHYLIRKSFMMIKNGIYFIVIALLLAELLKILLYAN